MTKNKVKIIALILAVLLICSGLVYFMTRNKTLAYKSSDIHYIGQSETDFERRSDYYCLNKGWVYEPGNYVLVRTGTLPELVAYAIGYEKYERQAGKTQPHTEDAITNIVWEILGANREHSQEVYVSDEFNRIKAQAELIQNLSAGCVSITAPDSMILANSAGEYGPFVINYPNINGELVGLDLTIRVNGNAIAIEDLIKKEDGYYLTEAHGIQIGKQNVVVVDYTAPRYYGAYYEYTREREIAIEVQCSECGGTGIYESLGIYYNGVVEKNEDVGWSGTINHTAACSRTAEIYEIGNAYPIYEKYQDVIKPQVIYEVIPYSDIVSFWGGTPDIEIKFNKVNTEGENVEGAKFNISVEGGTVEGENTISTVTGGNILRIKPKGGFTEITVTITETEAPEEYAILENPITLQYNWNNVSKQWDCSTQDFTFPTGEKVTIEQNIAVYDTDDNTTKYTVTAENKRKIIVNLLKTDNASNALENIAFDIAVIGGTCEENAIITDANGQAQIVIVPDSTSDVKLVLTENGSKGYKELDPIEITFTYRAGKWQTTINDEVKSQVTINGSIAIFDLEVVNIPIIEELTLIKTNKFVPEECLPGITFRIDLGNAKTETGNHSMTVTTDSQGQINLGMLEIIDASKEITITIEEIATPNDGLDYGSLVNTPVTITLRHNDPNSCKSDNSLVIPEYKVDQNIIEVEAQNEVTMKISGMVWEDGQTGIKPVQAPNGKIDSGETGIPGIIVNLKKNDGTIQQTTATDSTGNYEFKKVPISKNGIANYYIEFVYDGINYIATIAGGDSDATEKDRATFNNKFKTIEKDTAIGTDGTRIPLNYTYDATSATLETTVGGVVKEEFKMTADTRSTTSSTATRNIELGLVRKSVDLAAVTDIYEAIVTINGENKSYSYNDIASLDKDENGNPILGNLENKVEYNLHLYNSDYNYRIGDYQLPAARSDSLTVSERGAEGDLLAQRQRDGELNVEVTYQVLLSNQSATDATVNQIAYYYDSKYVLKTVSIDTGTISLEGGISTEEINSVLYNKVVLNVNADLTDADSQRVVNLTFDVGKDSSGNVYTGIMENLVEIISYSTNSGCIDRDSAPDNVTTVKNNEDDTDDAAGLNVRLNNIERQVSGFVFEDEKTNNPGAYNIGDGVYDANNSKEKKIDDVIVQLIEIKDIDTDGDKVNDIRLEYIWQETVSGSDKVKVVSIDGTRQINIKYTTDRSLNGTTYTENGTTYTYKYIPEEVKDGEYKFVDFIPGNYIVRFIYGDGTYWDTAKNTANLTTYNGQDYKSTKDIGYNKPWHNDSSYSQNSSMARDNEARRLEEMAYATSVTNASNLIIDTQDKLNATWMCADTSPIWMKVSDAETEGDTNSIVKNINFGLVERPKAILSLEKHITGLSIRDCGLVGDAAAGLREYQDARFNGLVLDVEGDLGVIAVATNKDLNQLGYWRIDTQADKIDEGTIKITYGYWVRNTGDLDYIGEELKRLLNEEGMTYTEIAADVKALSSEPSYIPGTYLGNAYYKYENRITNEVASTISVQIEDYISSTNGFKIDTTSDFVQKNTSTEEKHILRYNSTGSMGNAISDFEDVYVLRSKESYPLSANSETPQATLTVVKEKIKADNEIKFRSYAAQLIPSTGSITSTSGTICSGTTLGNLATKKSDGNYHGAVQSYVTESSVPIYEIVPEADEFIGEYVEITIDTGGDKATPIFLIITITSGLAIVAVGIVLVKKFVIK